MGLFERARDVRRGDHDTEASGAAAPEQDRTPGSQSRVEHDEPDADRDS